MSSVCRNLRFYLKNTNLHGLKYVADESKHPLFRMFWLAIFIMFGMAMLRIFRGSYESFQHNAISFVTETTYLDWNTTFPAISVCEITSSETFWTAEPNESYSPVQQFLSDIIFFTGSCYSCSTPCSECEKLNYREMVNRFRKKCSQLMKHCRWNDISFNCCDKFLPLETEYGRCFSINSLHTRWVIKIIVQYLAFCTLIFYYWNASSSIEGSNVELISNRKTGPGELYIETSDDIRLYIHAPEDVPFINSDPDQRKDVMLGESHSIIINIIEIANDENVKNVPVEKRQCLFPGEKSAELKVHSYYSYSTCIVQCHADAHARLCNCTHHLMPVLGKDTFCDMKGLQCLTDYFETVNRLHAKGFDKPGLVCECVPSCVEPEYKIVSERKGLKSAASEISIRLQSLPTFRFKRNVVRTTMDLVGELAQRELLTCIFTPSLVSIGGTAGLFIGASLLSIVEMIYLLLIRKY
ncbi:PREDICTED: pickpocket protein 28-like [Nicrophorus vespilloides]|uniref:Pickpocket protein 28-like n=1 Tax=Nicrophorus vespilloides TaxID=110193 RepID=A0ABM1MQQ0_NICVS|nr:PREDICTED: pickpocket protein 28-like [Nicrophorus vespilloides]